MLPNSLPLLLLILAVLSFSSSHLSFYFSIVLLLLPHSGPAKFALPFHVYVYVTLESSFKSHYVSCWCSHCTTHCISLPSCHSLSYPCIPDSYFLLVISSVYKPCISVCPLSESWSFFLSLWSGRPAIGWDSWDTLLFVYE